MNTLRKLSLRAKITIGMVIVFVIGIGASWAFMANVMQQRAERDVADKGTLLIEAMNAIRTYTSAHINPLLRDQLTVGPTFISESVPAFSARTVFENLRTNEHYGEFYYKEATLNPTNRLNLADDFETQILQQFNQDAATEQISGFRTLDGQTVFYSARPLRVSAETCLQCHSTPDVAPASLINTYGSEHGFGWALHDIISAQMIYVPADEVLNSARSSLNLVMGGVILVFTFVVIAVNLLLRRTVLGPITTMASLAKKIGAGNVTDQDLDAPQLQRVTDRGDELGEMTKVFKQMAQNVVRREAKMIQELTNLRIEIDHVKKAQQVHEITGSEYFQELKSKASQMRAQKGSAGAPAPNET